MPKSWAINQNGHNTLIDSNVGVDAHGEEYEEVAKGVQSDVPEEEVAEEVHTAPVIPTNTSPEAGAEVVRRLILQTHQLKFLLTMCIYMVSTQMLNELSGMTTTSQLTRRGSLYQLIPMESQVRKPLKTVPA